MGAHLVVLLGKVYKHHRTTTRHGTSCGCISPIVVIQRVIKVYKTSILTFKDRDRYVSGEFRFRHGYSKHNPRKMVKVWAEKEMRNLKRLKQAGIPCPEPLLLRMHVLLMEFLGDKNGWAYPRLKDASIPADRYPELYRQVVRNMRKMYQECKLVHADLSEYNLLYGFSRVASHVYMYSYRWHAHTVYFIDVSQSVEHDHPHALDFLRKDCQNITDYFAKHNVRVMSLRELFDFVTSIEFGNSDDVVEHELDRIVATLVDRPTEETKTEDDVFRQVYIPRNLDQVIDVERDVNRVTTGTTDQVRACVVCAWSNVCLVALHQVGWVVAAAKHTRPSRRCTQLQFRQFQFRQ